MRESHIKKRSIVINGRKTSVSLEDEFWGCLSEIASLESKTLQQIISESVASEPDSNRSSAIRLSVLRHYRRP